MKRKILTSISDKVMEKKFTDETLNNSLMNGSLGNVETIVLNFRKLQTLNSLIQSILKRHT